MSYYPITLDKERQLKYGMRAIDLIEKKFKKPIMKIEGMQDGNLTMVEYSILIWAGLVHEDRSLTPDKVMDLIDEHSSLKIISNEMWTAFNEVFKDEAVEEEETPVEGKNE